MIGQGRAGWSNVAASHHDEEVGGAGGDEAGQGQGRAGRGGVLQLPRTMMKKSSCCPLKCTLGMPYESPSCL